MYIKVKAFPKAKKEEIKKIAENRFEIRIKEKAERNLANQRIIKILAEYFEIEEKEVKIINGHYHSSKLIKINN